MVMMRYHSVLDKYRDMVVNGPVLRVLFKLGVPLMIVNVIMLLYNLADAYWLSRYMEYAVSIPRQAWPVLMLFNAFIMSFSMANMAILSQYMGARIYDKVNSTISNLFTLNILYGVLGYGLLYSISDPLFKYVVRTPVEIFDQTIVYVRIMGLDMIISSFMFTISVLLQSIGDTRTPARIQSFGAVVNAILDPFLINGYFIFPKLGVAGAAYASILSRLLSLIILYVVFHRRYGFIKIRFKPGIETEWLRLTLYAGVPLYAMQVSNMLAFIFNNSIVNSFGIVAATAMAVGFIIMDIADNVLMGFTQAATIMIGQNLGAGRKDRAREVALKSSHTLFLVIVAGAVIVYLLRKSFIQVFVVDDDVVAEADTFISLTAISLPFFGLFFMGLAVGRGSGRTLIPSIIGVIRLWLIRLLFGYYISTIIGMGTFGYWLAISLSNFVGGVLAYIWIKIGDWNKPIIKEIKQYAN